MAKHNASGATRQISRASSWVSARLEVMERTIELHFDRRAHNPIFELPDGRIAEELSDVTG